MSAETTKKHLIPTAPQYRALLKWEAGYDGFFTSYAPHKKCLEHGWVERCDTEGAFSTAMPIRMIMHRARLTPDGKALLRRMKEAGKS